MSRSMIDVPSPPLSHSLRRAKELLTGKWQNEEEEEKKKFN